jgi:hypothetical protein
MEKIKILCLGNSSTDTVVRSAAIAKQYSIELTGLLTEENTHIQPGCCYTDIGTVSVDYLRSICKSFDLIVLLDQTPDSYDHIDSFYQSMNTCLFLKHQQPVIIQLHSAWCYIVTYFKPTDSDSSVIKIKNNQELYQQVMVADLAKRNVVLQLSKVSGDDFDDFTMHLNLIVQKCRLLACRFVMFRADSHEQDSKLHYHLTKFLVQFPEFVLLTPNTFGADLNSNLEKIVLQHWSNLYE